MKTAVNTQQHNGADFLPNFCSGAAVFSVLAITELVAILITLAAVDASVILWERFVLLSIYLQWIGITSAAGLCLVRRYVRHLSGPTVAGLCYLLLLLTTALLSEIAWRLAALQDLFLILEMAHAEFLIRNLGVCAIVAALALRYFWIQHQWQREILSVGDARFQALQARIRPHFLFNTLNSIAELANGRPREAETAVEDLAALLRATLDDHDQPSSLAQELEITRAYARIESQRLGQRLRFEWNIPDSLLECSIPPLSLQPLVENAVRHGIEPLAEGGCICIEAALVDDTHYVISISNPTDSSDTKTTNPGTGEALVNIHQRLHWLFGDQGHLKIIDQAGQFEARLQLPIKPKARQA